MQFMSLVTIAIGGPLLFIVPFPSADLWPYIGGSMIVHMAYQISLVAMMKAGDYTLVYPISRGLGPVVVTLFSLLVLGRDLSPWEIAAIMAIVAGAMLAGLSGVKLDHLPRLPAVLLAVFVGVCIGSYTLIDGLGVKQAETPSTFIVWSMVAFVVPFQALGWALRGRELITQYRTEFWTYLQISVIALTGYVLALTAYRMGEIAILAAIRETSILFAAVFGTLLLKEEVTAKRLVAITLVATGAITLALLRG